MKTILDIDTCFIVSITGSPPNLIEIEIEDAQENVDVVVMEKKSLKQWLRNRHCIYSLFKKTARIQKEFLRDHLQFRILSCEEFIDLNDYSEQENYLMLMDKFVPRCDMPLWVLSLLYKKFSEFIPKSLLELKDHLIIQEGIDFDELEILLDH